MYEIVGEIATIQTAAFVRVLPSSWVAFCLQTQSDRLDRNQDRLRFAEEVCAEPSSTPSCGGGQIRFYQNTYADMANAKADPAWRN